MKNISGSDFEILTFSLISLFMQITPQLNPYIKDKLPFRFSSYDLVILAYLQESFALFLNMPYLIFGILNAKCTDFIQDFWVK